MRTPIRSIISAGILLPLCGIAGLFNIDVNFGAGMDDTYKAAFTDAATFWESNITGYRLNSGSLQGVSISAVVEANDGVGGVLGSAGPTSGFFFDNVVLDGDATSSYVLYASAGSMSFDSADVDNLISAGMWEQVIRHEMAHVLGFGTLWGYAGIYNNFYIDGSGEYTGAAGLAAYQAEFDASATYVPVELEGGTGTSDGHWDEVDGGAALTGITDAEGNDMAYELMTGWLNSPTFLSQTTLGQFYDLGYTVVPEPASIMMMAAISAVAFFVRRRYSYMA
jgi:hypothetical protein